ncbi:toll-like receptor 4 [Saccostrea cucullata]|uniref:toll-like receptor 4 n=1 Tax=Saccostrea cuccullata TaxID=36930 RepID=UPI002ED65606
MLYNSNSCDTKEGEITTVKGTKYRVTPTFFSYQLPPKLKFLSIADQKVYIPLVDNRYGITSKNSLTHVHIQGNLIYDIQHFSGLWRLEYLDLSNNFCFNITKQSFQGMGNLLFLNLSRNLLGKELKRQSGEHVFDHLRGLKVLDLSFNWITYLHKDIFIFASNIEHLNLSNNDLESVTFDLSGALKLRSIDLSSNKILILDSKSMDFLDASREKQLFIQMSSNPFQCTCQSREFLKWMKDSLNKHFVDKENYTCMFTDRKRIHLRNLDKILSSLELECASFTTTIVIVTIILLVTIILISFAIMYRYRWKLRYLYYAGKRSYSGYSRIFDSGREYQFDAFISYAESERAEFIPNLLKLERENNFKFCRYSRDFIIGVNVAENITNAIHNSKGTVCFLSKAFLESEFCIYEAQMARMESIYRGGETSLRIILADKDFGDVLPKFLKDIIIEQTYLEYDKDIQEEFWIALTQGLKDMTTTIVIVTIILLVTIILISFAIMYRYRWKLRYLYYAGKRSYRGYSRVLDSGREYQFDAFISYAESERTEFIPNLLKLERENNFKFCIHSRDFIIGVNVAENITNAIHNSKRTVCFLSKAFLQSEFCTYEAQMARMESIYRGGETTLNNILVDKDLGAVLPQFLKDVIREQIYLE